MSRDATKALAGETAATLRHWLEAVPNDRLAHLVRDAARALQRSLQARLAIHDVSFGHWVFLRILWEQDGLTQRELSVRAGVMEPTTLAAVRTLETLGYVTRRKKAANRKNVYVALTPKGVALKAKLVPLAEAVNEVAVAGIDPEALGVTRRTLLAMVSNLAHDVALTEVAERRAVRAMASLIPRARRRAVSPPAGAPAGVPRTTAMPAAPGRRARDRGPA
jgi:MarR family transcriptional regulator, organic hydroperoxide resistance regulator